MSKSSKTNHFEFQVSIKNQSFSNEVFKNQYFFYKSFRKLIFSNCCFESVALPRNCEDLIFQNCEFTNVYIDDADDLNNFHFDHCKIRTSSFTDCLLSNFYFTNCELTNVSFYVSFIDNMEFNDSKLFDVSFQQTDVEKLKIKNCTLQNIDYLDMMLVKFNYDLDSDGLSNENKSIPIKDLSTFLKFFRVNTPKFTSKFEDQEVLTSTMVFFTILTIISYSFLNLSVYNFLQSFLN